MYIENLSYIERRLASLSPDHRLVWAHDTFLREKIMVSASGKTLSLLYKTATIFRLLGEIAPVHALFVNTHLNEEYSPTTIPFVQMMAEQGPEYGYDLHIYEAILSITALRATHPRWDEAGTADNLAAKQVLKEDPFNRALADFGTLLWINGARRDEQVSRATIPILSRRQDGVYVLSPFADVPQHELDQYVREQGLPRNDAHFDALKGAEQQDECGLLIYKNSLES